MLERLNLRATIGFLIAVIGFGLLAAAAAGGNKMAVLPIGALFGIAGALVLLDRPALIFWLMALTSLFNDQLGLPVGGMNVRPYVGLSLLGLGALALMTATRDGHYWQARALRIIPLVIPLIGLVLAKLVSWYLITEQPMGMPKSFPLKHLIFATLLVCTAFVVAVYLPGRRNLEKMVVIWIWLSSIAGVVGFIQLVASNTIGMHWVHQREVIFYGRPFSWFREPDVFGSVMGATTVMLLPLLVLRSRIMERKWLLVHLSINGTMLLLLFVRAAWLGSVVACAFFTLCLFRSKRFELTFPYMKAMAGGLIALILILPIAAPSFIEDISERFASMANPEEEGASAYRMQDLGAMMAEISPAGPADTRLVKLLFGHGDMTWSYWAPFKLGGLYDTNALNALRNHGIVMVHPGFCMVISYLFDNGLAGMLCALTFYIMLFGRVFVLIHRHVSDDDASLLLATALPVLLLLVCFQFSYDPISPFYWVLIGLALAAIDAVVHPEENL